MLLKMAAAKDDAATRAEITEHARLSALAALNGIEIATDAPPAAPDLPPADLTISGALHPTVQYAYGQAEAYVPLARALLASGHPVHARQAARYAHDLQSRLRHPDLPQTAALLQSLPK
jgi:hypothetical protein